jgi:hypothetical protein
MSFPSSNAPGFRRLLPDSGRLLPVFVGLAPGFLDDAPGLVPPMLPLYDYLWRKNPVSLADPADRLFVIELE